MKKRRRGAPAFEAERNRILLKLGALVWCGLPAGQRRTLKAVAETLAAETKLIAYSRAALKAVREKHDATLRKNRRWARAFAALDAAKEAGRATLDGGSNDAPRATDAAKDLKALGQVRGAMFDRFLADRARKSGRIGAVRMRRILTAERARLRKAVRGSNSAERDAWLAEVGDLAAWFHRHRDPTSHGLLIGGAIWVSGDHRFSLIVGKPRRIAGGREVFGSIDADAPVLNRGVDEFRGRQGWALAKAFIAGGAG